MRQLAAFALAVAMLAPTRSFGETNEGSPPELVRAARRAREAGDDEEAVLLARRALDVEGGLEGRERGRALLLLGMALLDLDRPAEAIEPLAEAAPLLPELGDRLALARGRAFLGAGRPGEAAEQFAAARSKAALELVAMEAEDGRVRALLAAGSKLAVQRAFQHLARYHSLPEKRALEYEIARALEKQGRRAAAYVRYRKLWIEAPESEASERSRERIEALAADGLRVAPFRHTELLERVRGLIDERRFDDAEAEITTGLRTAKGAVQLHLQLELAILAYRRGELDRAMSLLLELQDRRGPTGPYIERVAIASGDTSPAIRRIFKGRAPTSRTPAGKLVRAAEVHLAAGEYEKARRIISRIKMARAPGFLARWIPWIRFKLGEYDRAIPGLSRLHEERWSRGRRAYWVGRAHHLAGRPCEARASYEAAVLAAPHGYYGLWGRLRLADLRDEVAARQSEDGAEPLRCPAPTEEDPEATAAWTPPDPLKGWKLGPRARGRPTEAEGLAAFEKLIAAHGDALPWLARARELWLSGDEVGAGEELHQTLWASRGYLAPKIGLPRLWGGRPRIKRAGRRRPARFDDEQLRLYVTAAEAVGETGLAIRANRPDWSDLEGWHPLAFEPLVRAMADRHDLSPELLWSIMRVESYFDRHAISNAHALGLVQVLPRTGRRIARAVGARDFAVHELLSPRRALDFGAWYLGALERRFHGQYPLIVAAYNGGPHNVASWITRRSDTDRPLPMDELCEEIPFEETYRYVRRVLGSMAVYHALAGLPPPDLPRFVNRDVAEGVNF